MKDRTLMKSEIGVDGQLWGLWKIHKGAPLHNGQGWYGAWYELEYATHKERRQTNWIENDGDWYKHGPTFYYQWLPTTVFPFSTTNEYGEVAP